MEKFLGFLLFSLVLAILISACVFNPPVFDYPRVEVTVAEVCKDEFGFAIKTESGKCIQIRGGSEACFLGLKIGNTITVPVSDNKIYSINIEDIK